MNISFIELEVDFLNFVVKDKFPKTDVKKKNGAYGCQTNNSLAPISYLSHLVIYFFQINFLFV